MPTTDLSHSVTLLSHLQRLAEPSQVVCSHGNMATKVTASDTETTINSRCPGFTDLPRELRDAIYSLAIGDEDRNLSMTDRPCEGYRNLIQILRLVREEAADVYWSSPDRSVSYLTFVSAFAQDLTDKERPSFRHKRCPRHLGICCHQLKP